MKIFKDYNIPCKSAKRIAKETNIDVKIKDTFDECKIEEIMLRVTTKETNIKVK